MVSDFVLGLSSLVLLIHSHCFILLSILSNHSHIKQLKMCFMPFINWQLCPRIVICKESKSPHKVGKDKGLNAVGRKISSALEDRVQWMAINKRPRTFQTFLFFSLQHFFRCRLQRRNPKEHWTGWETKSGQNLNIKSLACNNNLQYLWCF